MRNWLLSFTFLLSSLFSADVNLSIDNFIDNGDGTVTFDIMMSNTEPVGGFQFNFLSGNGVYDGGDDCRCDQSDDALPAGCDECYYDYGVDKIRNNKELDTSTSGYSYGCEDSGICSDDSLSSSDCEDEGVCSDLGDCHTYLTQEDCPTASGGGLCSWDSAGDDGCYLGKTSCLDIGTCSNSEFDNNECDCTASGASWESTNYWIPDESYIPFNSTEDCFANVNTNDIQLRWDYYNPDGNNDNYATIEGLIDDDGDMDYDYLQRCYVPEFSSDFQGDCLYDTDFDGVCNLGEQLLTAGHCDQFTPICVSTGEYNTVDIGQGILLDWEMDCCINTNGGEVFEPSRNKEVCEGTVNFGSFENPQLVELENESGSPVSWTWTAYDDEATCVDNGGFWYGSESGTEGNAQYDLGEYYIDGDATLAITQGSGGAAAAAGFIISASGSTVLAVNFSGGTIPVSETPVSLATFTANHSGLADSDIIELLSMSVCGSGELGDWGGSTSCPNDLIFSDSGGDALTADFNPSIWTVGTGISDIASDDGICSSIGGWGEDSEDDASCAAYCGDGYCNNDETFGTCSVDCQSSCGDGICSLFEGNDDGEVETSETCPADCNVFGCGDFICSEGETNDSCPYDCYSAFCGDGSCDTVDGENVFNCYDDCQPICGNGVEDEGETFANCPSDAVSVCGDGVYDHAGVDYDLDGVFGTEDETCASDYEIVCGDGVYHYIDATIAGITATLSGQCTGEDSQDCQAEFFPGAVADETKWCEQDYSQACGDLFYHHSGYTYEVDDYSECTTGENIADCVVVNEVSAPGLETGDAEDTENYCESDYELTIGDGYCDATTDNYTDNTCVSDCDAENPGIEDACPSVCGDGFYDYLSIGGTETGDASDSENYCESDYSVTQGDEYCDESAGEVVGENVDCPLPVCGDNECEVPFENFVNCNSDCLESFCGDGQYDHSGVDLNGDGEFGSEDDTCVEDYGVTCGDGVYDWEAGENADGNDDGSEPDCDYIQTCGDGYYDYTENQDGNGEVISCYTAYGDGVAFDDYITNCLTYDFCDYVLTDGDGFCDPINQENLEFHLSTDDLNCDSCPNEDTSVCPLECLNEDYSEADCVVLGCTNSTACNFDSTATTDDGSCLYACADPGGCAELDSDYDCEGELLSVAFDFPVMFSLNNNYPNPFNPVTSIEYSVEKAGNVNIAIYNIMGHKVTDLVSGHHLPGRQYSVTWNSNTQSNIPVSTGIYFYEMRSGDYVEKKKMVLVK